MQRTIRLLLAAGLVLGMHAPAQAAERPIEGYAAYRPQTHCSPKPKAGTLALAHWLVHRYDGTSIVELRRACDVGGTSEHKEGRALDWGVDVTKPARLKQARAFLRHVFATDADGHHDAVARRMGIMYLIFNGHIWGSYADHFARRGYLPAQCAHRHKGTATLCHRNHLHISLSRRGGRGQTSWYDGRLD